MKVNRWTIGRRCIQLSVLLLLASPAFGWSFFEGTLAGASIVGLQLSDPLAALQVLLLTGTLTSTMWFGTAIVVVFYGVLGGRTFCGWICPVHLLTDLVDMLPWPKKLSRRPLQWKTTVLIMTAILTLILGLPAFETVSPIGIAARVLTFGASSSLVVLILIVIVELFFVRRVWCRSLCPLGGFYSQLGRLGPLAVAYDAGRCSHCGNCQNTCFVPEVLSASLDNQVSRVHSGDCTRCGACIGACPDKALNFGFRNPFAH